MSKKNENTEIEKTTNEFLDSATGGVDVNALKASTTFEELLKAGFETEQFMTMDEGDRIIGYFLGRGPDTSVGDGQRAPKRTCSTWLFKHPNLGVKIRILGSARTEDGNATGLDQELVSLPVGAMVYVEKGEQEDIGGGRRVNRWRVACNPKKRLANIADYTKGSVSSFPALPAHAAAPANGQAEQVIS